MKKIIEIFLLCALVIFNTGCVSDKAINEKELDVMEEVSEGEKLLILSNANFKIYDEISKQRQFYVDVVTKEKINEEKLSVRVDGGVSYKYSIELVKNEEMDLNTYLEYIGKGEQLEKLKKDDYSSYEQKIERYAKSLEERKIKKIFHYRIYITITQIFNDTKIDVVNIQYNNTKYSIHVGNIEIYSDAELDNKEKGINMITIAASEVKVKKNENGIENYIDSQVFKTIDKITIKDIRLFNSSSKIDKCSFTIENPGYSIEQEWKGEGIDIQKDSTVGINLNIINSKLKSNYEYQGNEYVIIEYECRNKNYCTYWEVNFDTSLTGYELCAYLREKLQNEK